MERPKRQYSYKRRVKAPGTYQRDRSDDLYHTSRWTRASRAFRIEHPLCAECLRNGIVTPAEVVDHIIPAPICKDFFDESNWQSLCKKCNAAKGNRDKTLITKHKGKGVSNL